MYLGSFSLRPLVYICSISSRRLSEKAGLYSLVLEQRPCKADCKTSPVSVLRIPAHMRRDNLVTQLQIGATGLHCSY